MDRAMAQRRRVPGRVGDVVLAEALLRAGRLREARAALGGLPALRSRVGEYGMAVENSILLIDGPANGMDWSTVGRIASMTIALERQQATGSLNDMVRLSRSARLAALVDPARAKAMGQRVWRNGYLGSDPILAADGLMTIAAVAGDDAATAAVAARAEFQYVQAGMGARAVIARASRRVATRPLAPLGADRLCFSSAGSMSLVRAECLLAVLEMTKTTASYAEAVQVADRLLALRQGLPGSFLTRFSLTAAPIYELVGRPMDSDLVLSEALRRNGPPRADVAIQLAGLRRRTGRPTSARRILDELGRLSAAPEEVRRLVELALVSISLGDGVDIGESLMRRAVALAGNREELLVPVELAAWSIGATGPAGSASRLRALHATLVDRKTGTDRSGAQDSVTTRVSLSAAARSLDRLGDGLESASGLGVDDNPTVSWRSNVLLQHVRTHLAERSWVAIFRARSGSIDVELVSATDARKATLRVVPARLQSLVELWAASIEGNATEAWQTLGRTISRLLLAQPDIRDVFLNEADHLIVVGDVGVYGLPFAALPAAWPGRPQTFLSDRVAFSRAASLASLDAAWHRPASPSHALVLLPDTALGDTESRAVLSARDGLALKGPRATESALERLAPTAGLIHFGGHSEPVAGTWSVGGLGLHPNRMTDGQLTFDEIARLDIRGARVVLLGCETGRGRRFALARAPDPQTSLASAFLAAGARSTIGTLWRITNDEAGLLADELYAAGGAWQGAHSLANAIRRLRYLYPDKPRLWATGIWDGAPDDATPAGLPLADR